jgi:protein ImuB
MVDSGPDAALYAALYQPPAADHRSPTNDRRGSDQRRAASDHNPLVRIAAEFSPRYEQHRPDLVSIDLRGLSSLFGTPRTIGEELRRDAAARGVRVHVAVAPSCTAALVLARARPGLTVVNVVDQAPALAAIPLSVLELLHEDCGSSWGGRLCADDAAAAIAAVKGWGLRTVGELAALPADDLSARLGNSGRMWQAIARGEDTRPLVPMQREERFEAALELEWPIEGTEPLSFVLTRLLEPLSTRLERRDRGAAVLHVALRLVTRDVHVCRLELPSPLRDVRALRTLALLDVEAHPPAAAIDRVTVTIDPTPGRIVQHMLFTRPHPTPEQLSTLIARLGALMGQDRVGAPARIESYRPGAFAMVSFATDQGSGTRDQGPGRQETEDASVSRLPSPAPCSALRRCRPPVPARVAEGTHHRPLRVSSERRGFAGGAVAACAGPWRTSGAWWEDLAEGRRQTADVGSQTYERGPVPPKPVLNDVGEGGWSRDEWDVALTDGTVYRVFRDRMTDRWFIEGTFD